MPFRVLIPAHFEGDLAEAAAVAGAELVPYDKDGNALRDPSGSRALFRWWISTERGDRWIRELPDLQWIHTGSAGVDHILTPAFLASKVTLTNSAGVHASSIAEWVVASMLALQKDLRTMFRQQDARVWEKVERDEISSDHVVILGSGHIANEIAKRLRGLGVRLTTVRRSREPNPLFDRSVSIDELSTVVADADWLIIALPLTPETQRLVDRDLLRRLPSSARVVNVARGEIVDEGALVEALAEKRIAGAVLDVFEREPLDESSPLWKMDNVIVLPHTTWRSPRVRQRQVDLFAENLWRFARGEELINVVDVKRRY